ncbi:hypothetical protein AMTR_s00028p00221070 [Amborella trichopoda]|uniref:Uncharacterized protein n=1 Tax=Amborella trichopoda TaxID=13333 RepID=W1PRL0_AMBTC|nr:hypothetical protein AMTR_s00028p00221070 [Amborella trichopoda]
MNALEPKDDHRGAERLITSRGGTSSTEFLKARGVKAFEVMQTPSGGLPRGPLEAGESKDCAVGKPEGQDLKIPASSYIGSGIDRTDTTECAGDTTQLLTVRVTLTSTLDMESLGPYPELS